MRCEIDLIQKQNGGKKKEKKNPKQNGSLLYTDYTDLLAELAYMLATFVIVFSEFSIMNLDLNINQYIFLIYSLYILIKNEEYTVC